MTRSDLADVAMTWTALKEMSRSPAHCRYRALEPDGGEQTLAMRLGSGVHALTFGTPPVLVYDGRRSGKAWDAFRSEAEAAGAIVLNKREHAIAQGMTDALRADPVAAPLLFADGVEYEQPMAWTVDGRAYRTRGVDFRHRGRKYIGELKSARSAKPGQFDRCYLGLLYPAQLEIYDEGDAILTGRDREADPFALYIVAVEPTPPHAVCVYVIADSARRAARRKIGMYRSILATCEAANAWPSYSLSPVPFEVDESAFDSVDASTLAPDAGPFESAAWSAGDDGDIF